MRLAARPGDDWTDLTTPAHDDSRDRFGFGARKGPARVEEAEPSCAAPRFGSTRRIGYLAESVGLWGLRRQKFPPPHAKIFFVRTDILKKRAAASPEMVLHSLLAWFGVENSGFSSR